MSHAIFNALRRSNPHTSPNIPTHDTPTIHAPTHTYTSTYMHTHTYTYPHIHLHIPTPTHTYTYPQIHTCTLFAHKHSHAVTQSHVHLHHTPMYTPKSKTLQLDTSDYGRNVHELTSFNSLRYPSWKY